MKPRHFIPTIAQLPARRYARPCDAYDVMRVRDSWLCANLADAHLIESAKLGLGTPILWQTTFDRLMSKLGSDSWTACVKKYLS